MCVCVGGSECQVPKHVFIQIVVWFQEDLIISLGDFDAMPEGFGTKSCNVLLCFIELFTHSTGRNVLFYC